MSSLPHWAYKKRADFISSIYESRCSSFIAIHWIVWKTNFHIDDLYASMCIQHTIFARTHILYIHLHIIIGEKERNVISLRMHGTHQHSKNCNYLLFKTPIRIYRNIRFLLSFLLPLLLPCCWQKSFVHISRGFSVFNGRAALASNPPRVDTHTQRKTQKLKRH